MATWGPVARQFGMYWLGGKVGGVGAGEAVLEGIFAGGGGGVYGVRGFGMVLCHAAR